MKENKRVIIVSNRLPVSIHLRDDEVDLTPSVGGLATGMKAIYKTYDGIWIGWPGVMLDDLDKRQVIDIGQKLKTERCVPVYLNQEDLDHYYFGFSNQTIWPLFHYFTQYTEYNRDYWEAYKRVNQQFADVILQYIQPGDTLWVHDYHLMLLPALLREKHPDLNIGFFLHIPFPSYEVFRICPWRSEIIEGLLGADLIGFHTYDYERHFLSSVRRLLGHDIEFNQITVGQRIVKVDAFPMGIDYEKFSQAAIAGQQRSVKDKSEVQREIERHLLNNEDLKLILSIDRLDYSKGIPNRLHAYEHFLEKYPGYLGKVTLVMLCVPSRDSVAEYKMMKSEVDELVGRINGKYASIEWSPIWYFYRSMPLENLVDLYNASEIALITPVRDGMNLVAKEYIASKTDQKGVLILSEMAGAAKELSEALIINPNNVDEIADAIKTAYEMPVDEQIDRNAFMQERIKRYNIEKWAVDFMASLEKVQKVREKYMSRKMNSKIGTQIVNAYQKAKKRIIFLDYDGTLVGFHNDPAQASPDKELYAILDAIVKDENNRLVLISGRDRETFQQWFGDKPYNLIVEHGVWVRRASEDWKFIEKVNNEWKEIIRPAIESYVDRTPGSFIEDKNYSLVWHYRKSDPELGILRSLELKDDLTSFTANHNLEIMEGNKVIEIKTSGINKGRAASFFVGDNIYDFTLAIGDDWTDEYLFEAMPEKSFTIKVGMGNTLASYNVEDHKVVRNLLKSLVDL